MFKSTWQTLTGTLPHTWDEARATLFILPEQLPLERQLPKIIAAVLVTCSFSLRVYLKQEQRQAVYAYLSCYYSSQAFRVQGNLKDLTWYQLLTPEQVLCRVGEQELENSFDSSEQVICLAEQLASFKQIPAKLVVFVRKQELVQVQELLSAQGMPFRVENWDAREANRFWQEVYAQQANLLGYKAKQLLAQVSEAQPGYLLPAYLPLGQEYLPAVPAQLELLALPSWGQMRALRFNLLPSFNLATLAPSELALAHQTLGNLLALEYNQQVVNLYCYSSVPTQETRQDKPEQERQGEGERKIKAELKLEPQEKTELKLEPQEKTEFELEPKGKTELKLEPQEKTDFELEPQEKTELKLNNSSEPELEQVNNPKLKAPSQSQVQAEPLTTNPSQGKTFAGKAQLSEQDPRVQLLLQIKQQTWLGHQQAHWQQVYQVLERWQQQQSNKLIITARVPDLLDLTIWQELPLDFVPQQLKLHWWQGQLLLPEQEEQDWLHPQAPARTWHWHLSQELYLDTLVTQLLTDYAQELVPLLLAELYQSQEQAYLKTLSSCLAPQNLAQVFSHQEELSQELWQTPLFYVNWGTSIGQRVVNYLKAHGIAYQDLALDFSLQRKNWPEYSTLSKDKTEQDHLSSPLACPYTQHELQNSLSATCFMPQLWQQLESSHLVPAWGQVEVYLPSASLLALFPELLAACPYPQLAQNFIAVWDRFKQLLKQQAWQQDFAQQLQSQATWVVLGKTPWLSTTWQQHFLADSQRAHKNLQLSSAYNQEFALLGLELLELFHKVKPQLYSPAKVNLAQALAYEPLELFNLALAQLLQGKKASQSSSGQVSWQEVINQLEQGISLPCKQGKYTSYALSHCSPELMAGKTILYQEDFFTSTASVPLTPLPSLVLRWLDFKLAHSYPQYFPQYIHLSQVASSFEVKYRAWQAPLAMLQQSQHLWQLARIKHFSLEQVKPSFITWVHLIQKLQELGRDPWQAQLLLSALEQEKRVCSWSAWGQKFFAKPETESLEQKLLFYLMQYLEAIFPSNFTSWLENYCNELTIAWQKQDITLTFTSPSLPEPNQNTMPFTQRHTWQEQRKAWAREQSQQVLRQLLDWDKVFNSAQLCQAWQKEQVRQDIDLKAWQAWQGTQLYAQLAPLNIDLLAWQQLYQDFFLYRKLLLRFLKAKQISLARGEHLACLSWQDSHSQLLSLPCQWLVYDPQKLEPFAYCAEQQLCPQQIWAYFLWWQRKRAKLEQDWSLREQAPRAFVQQELGIYSLSQIHAQLTQSYYRRVHHRSKSLARSFFTSKNWVDYLYQQNNLASLPVSQLYPEHDFAQVSKYFTKEPEQGSLWQRYAGIAEHLAQAPQVQHQVAGIKDNFLWWAWQERNYAKLAWLNPQKLRTNFVSCLVKVQAEQLKQEPLLRQELEAQFLTPQALPRLLSFTAIQWQYKYALLKIHHERNLLPLEVLQPHYDRLVANYGLGSEPSLIAQIRTGLSREGLRWYKQEQTLAEADLERSKTPAETDFMRAQTTAEADLMQAQTPAEADLVRSKTPAEVDLVRSKTTAEVDLVRSKTPAEVDLVRSKTTAEVDLVRSKTTAEVDLEQGKTPAEADLERSKTTAEADLERSKTLAETDLMRAQTLAEVDLVRSKTTAEVDLMRSKTSAEADLERSKTLAETGLMQAQTPAEVDLEQGKTTAEDNLERVQTTAEVDLMRSKTTAETDSVRAQTTAEADLMQAQTPAESDLEQSKTPAEVNLEQVKTTAEGDLERSKTPAEVGLVQAKTPAEVNLERSKTPAEADLVQALTPAEANLEQDKNSAEANLMRAQTTAEVYLEQSKTPAEDNLERSRTPAEANLMRSKTTAETDSVRAQTTAEADLERSKTTVEVDSVRAQTPAEADSVRSKTPAEADLEQAKTTAQANFEPDKTSASTNLPLSSQSHKTTKLAEPRQGFWQRVLLKAKSLFPQKVKASYPTSTPIEPRALAHYWYDLREDTYLTYLRLQELTPVKQIKLELDLTNDTSPWQLQNSQGLVTSLACLQVKEDLTEEQAIAQAFAHIYSPAQILASQGISQEQVPARTPVSLISQDLLASGVYLEQVQTLEPENLSLANTYLEQEQEVLAPDWFFTQMGSALPEHATNCPPGIYLNAFEGKQIAYSYLFGQACYSMQFGYENKHFMQALADAYIDPQLVQTNFWGKEQQEYLQVLTPEKDPQESFAFYPQRASQTRAMYQVQAQALTSEVKVPLKSELPLSVDMHFARYRVSHLDLHLAKQKPELEVNQLMSRARFYYLFWTDLLPRLKNYHACLVGNMDWQFFAPSSAQQLSQLYMSTYSVYHLSAEQAELAQQLSQTSQAYAQYYYHWRLSQVLVQRE
ncbi:hypothetical protein CJP74_00030 [Psittacicella melopsittaci]|uniref:Uncharacterized protein n=1 Tax=Psittacicella melopsittaci TaxID=2028576 RepID=A0A3A1Y9I4_9GAMM|nr:hypothetical protein [Psittacicella melopsittaci]RIY34211.1 hypothetical protein CJP74_00030 [Psittacicella melopsittaci]